MKRRLSAVGAVLALILAGCAPPQEFIGEPAPALAGEDLAGEHRDLAALEGSVVLVTVWASWCAPCREEVGALIRAEADLGADGLQVLGVNFRDLPEAAESFVEREGATYPSIVDVDGSLSVPWGVKGVPQSYLIDRDGILVAQHIGAVTDEWVADVVAPEVLQ